MVCALCTSLMDKHFSAFFLFFFLLCIFNEYFLYTYAGMHIIIIFCLACFYFLIADTVALISMVFFSFIIFWTYRLLCIYHKNRFIRFDYMAYLIFVSSFVCMCVCLCVAFLRTRNWVHSQKQFEQSSINNDTL